MNQDIVNLIFEIFILFKLKNKYSFDFKPL
jgi:hypothetical protein